MTRKKAVVTGVTGQDGAYLSALLLGMGYEVYGSYRRTSTLDFWRIEYLNVINHENFHLVNFDLTDQSSAFRLIQTTRPDELYNLAAQSFVEVSFDQPLTTGAITGLGPVHLLEAVRILKPDVRFYQASTSEMFGQSLDVPQTEETPFHPRSPYAAAKLYSHWMAITYREAYDLRTVCGILFNHESPLRGLDFVTRKITDAVSRIKLGRQSVLEVGNLSAKRDWGYAVEYVEGMWRMLQMDSPETLILATGRTATVRDFVNLAFNHVDIGLEWRGEGEGEEGVDPKTGKVLVRVNPRFFRPAEVELLLGDPSKAKRLIGWEPKTSLELLCGLMMEADLARAAKA